MINNWIVLVNLYTLVIPFGQAEQAISSYKRSDAPSTMLNCFFQGFMQQFRHKRIRNSLLQQFKYHDPISGSPTLSRSWVEPKYGKVVLSLYKNSTAIITKILRILWRKLHTLKSHQFILKKCLFEGINRGSKLVWKISATGGQTCCCCFFYLRWVSMVNCCTCFILVFL